MATVARLASAALGRRAVPEYRAYLIGHDGHFRNAVPLVCADDAEAEEKAKQLVDGHDVELWQRDRKVATFGHKPKSVSN
jgi:hypothetical protein